MSIYEIYYLDKDNTSCLIKVMAATKKEAMRKVKAHTGCLIKDMLSTGTIGLNCINPNTKLLGRDF